MEEFLVISIVEVALKSKSNKGIYNLITTERDIFTSSGRHTLQIYFTNNLKGEELLKMIRSKSVQDS